MTRTKPADVPAYATTREAAQRQLPWNAMGDAIVISDNPTVTQALERAGLDYTVETRTAIAGDTNGSDPAARRPLKAPGFQAIVRPMPDGSEKVLAFTRGRYTPIQNADAFKVADYLVSEFGAQITGAADYRGGDRSILVAQLPDTITLEGKGGADPVDLSLVITNDHAGNAALTLALTPVRILCTNVLPAALKTAERAWKISHTPKAMERLDLASDAIKRAMVYRDAFQEQAQAMIDQEMTDQEFGKLVQRLYPVKRDDEGVKAERRRELHATLETLWHTSPTIENVRGTRWAGYNVVTEYLDHMRPVRAGEGLEGVARAEGALDGPYVRQKAALWGMFAAA